MKAQRTPKSDDSHNFWNYAMTADEVAAYLEKKRRRRDKAERAEDEHLPLIAAE